MIPLSTITSGARSAMNVHGDSPAMQATRMAATETDIFYADGSQLFCQSQRELPESKLLWTSKDAIQSVATSQDGSQIAAIDGWARVWMNGQTPNEGKNSNEFGWCGLAFDAQSPSLALTRMWERDTQIVDLETSAVLVTFAHAHIPIAICASPSKPGVFFCCEWNTATVWDSRSKIALVETLTGNQLGGGGCGPLWAVAAEATTFCVGGEDRVVSTMDDRKWRSFDLWKTPLKHDCVGLVAAAASQQRRRQVAIGLDHEIVERPPLNAAGDATTSRRLHDNHRVFRTRARWSGIASTSQALFARDAQGTIYSF